MGLIGLLHPLLARAGGGDVFGGGTSGDGAGFGGSGGGGPFIFYGGGSTIGLVILVLLITFAFRTMSRGRGRRSPWRGAGGPWGGGPWGGGPWGGSGRQVPPGRPGSNQGGTPPRRDGTGNTVIPARMEAVRLVVTQDGRPVARRRGAGRRAEGRLEEARPGEAGLPVAGPPTRACLPGAVGERAKTWVGPVVGGRETITPSGCMTPGPRPPASRLNCSLSAMPERCRPKAPWT